MCCSDPGCLLWYPSQQPGEPADYWSPHRSAHGPVDETPGEGWQEWAVGLTLAARTWTLMAPPPPPHHHPGLQIKLFILINQHFRLTKSFFSDWLALVNYNSSQLQISIIKWLTIRRGLNPVAFTLISGTYSRYRGVSNNRCHPKSLSRQIRWFSPSSSFLHFFMFRESFLCVHFDEKSLLLYLSHGAHLRRHGIDSLSD